MKKIACVLGEVGWPWGGGYTENIQILGVSPWTPKSISPMVGN